MRLALGPLFLPMTMMNDDTYIMNYFHFLNIRGRFSTGKQRGVFVSGRVE